MHVMLYVFRHMRTFMCMYVTIYVMQVIMYVCMCVCVYVCKTNACAIIICLHPFAALLAAPSVCTRESIIQPSKGATKSCVRKGRPSQHLGFVACIPMETSWLRPCLSPIPLFRADDVRCMCVLFRYLCYTDDSFHGDPALACRDRRRLSTLFGRHFVHFLTFSLYGISHHSASMCARCHRCSCLLNSRDCLSCLLCMHARESVCALYTPTLYKHTYLQTCMNTHLLTYIPTNTYARTYARTFVSNVGKRKTTYVCTYVHTVHTYKTCTHKDGRI